MNRLLAITSVVVVLNLPNPACAQSKERFPALSADQLSTEQKQYAEMIATPPRKSNFMAAPYRIWIRSPELATHMTAMNEYLRFNTGLPLRMTQFAILIAARQRDSHRELVPVEHNPRLVGRSSCSSSRPSLQIL